MHTSNSRSQPRLNCFSTKIRRKSRTSFDTFAAQASPVASVCSSSRSSSTLSPAASARSSMKDSERRPSSGSSKSSSRKGDVRELRIQLAGIPDPSMLDVGTGGRTSSRILTAGRATQQKQFYDSHLRQGRQANAIRPRLSPGSTKSVKREMMARAREREKDTSEIKIGGYVYENGRVANKSITSVDAPDWFKRAFNSNFERFRSSAQVMRSKRVRKPHMLNIGRVHQSGRVDCGNLVSKQSPTWMKGQYKSFPVLQQILEPSRDRAPLMGHIYQATGRIANGTIVSSENPAWITRQLQRNRTHFQERRASRRVALERHRRSAAVGGAGSCLEPGDILRDELTTAIYKAGKDIDSAFYDSRRGRPAENGIGASGKRGRVCGRSGEGGLRGQTARHRARFSGRASERGSGAAPLAGRHCSTSHGDRRSGAGPVGPMFSREEFVRQLEGYGVDKGSSDMRFLLHKADAEKKGTIDTVAFCQDFLRSDKVQESRQRRKEQLVANTLGVIPNSKISKDISLPLSDDEIH